jgi:hypothetical protein
MPLDVAATFHKSRYLRAIPQLKQRSDAMLKLPRRKLLQMAAGAAVLPAISRTARRKPGRRGRCASW